MRGDFVHAGGAMWHPRCHMKFYPRAKAGLVKKRNDNYWLLPKFRENISQETNDQNVEHVFLWQYFNFPFSFPHIERTWNKKLACVEEAMTFPPELTQRLIAGNRKKHAHPT
jgi:hypothetical protein